MLLRQLGLHWPLCLQFIVSGENEGERRKQEGKEETKAGPYF